MATARRRPARPSTPRGRAAPPDAPDAEPTVDLVGPPGHLAATVSVDNGGRSSISLRDSTISAPDLPGATARLGARVPAGRTADVPVRVRLAAATPPGTYPAQLAVGGREQAARVRVEPDLDLRVRPRRTLAAQGSQPVDVRVDNRGNVAVPLARRVRAALWCDGVVTDLDAALTLDGGGVVVEPGTAVDAHGRLVVPPGLDPTRRYEARLPVGVSDLLVLVLPTDDDESEKP